MTTVEMVDLPADGTANPGGHWHMSELHNLYHAIDGAGVLGRTLDMTVTEANRVVTIPIFNAWVPDGAGALVLVEKASATNISITTAASNPRTDIIVMDSAGTIAVTDGTATAETGTVEEAPMAALADDEIMLCKVRAVASQSNVLAADVVGRAIDVKLQHVDIAETAVQLFRRNIDKAVALLGASAGGVTTADGDKLGVGWAAVVQGGTATVTPGAGTTLGGSYVFTAGTTNNGDAGIRGPFFGAANDWTLICRVILPTEANQIILIGKPPAPADFSDGNDIIAWRVIDAGTLQGICDSAGSETARDTSVTPDGSTEHILEIDIRTGGTIVKFFRNNAQVGADVTTNIPTDVDEISVGIKTEDTTSSKIECWDASCWREV